MTEREARQEAARLMGRATSERKTPAVRENGRKHTGRKPTEQERERMRAAQRARRARERAQAQGIKNRV